MSEARRISDGKPGLRAGRLDWKSKVIGRRSETFRNCSAVKLSWIGQRIGAESLGRLDEIMFAMTGRSGGIVVLMLMRNDSFASSIP